MSSEPDFGRGHDPAERPTTKKTIRFTDDEMDLVEDRVGDDNEYPSFSEAVRNAIRAQYGGEQA